jgi:murein tripeptide amidase MpaA
LLAESPENFDDVFRQVGVGSMQVYMTEKELSDLYGSILVEFPELIRQFEVGRTYEDRAIYGYAFALNLTQRNWQPQAMKRPAILINAVHHARELTTISMTNYFVLKLLHGYLNGDAEAWKVLEDAVVFVIPVVNQDGFSAINQLFERNGKLALIRKNRHFYSTQAECSDEGKGVDLNRNYPYKFAFDNQGSSG